MLPLVLASVVLGAIVYRLGSSRLKQTGALLAAATFAGIVATAMVQSWLGALEARGW